MYLDPVLVFLFYVAILIGWFMSSSYILGDLNDELHYSTRPKP